MKSLLLIATLVSVVYASEVCQAADDGTSAQRVAAIGELERVGAEFQFSPESNPQKKFSVVKEIKIRAEDFSAWDKIRDFPEVEQLDLAGSSIGDDAIRHLLSLKNLRGLYLDATEVTGASLVEIGRIATLETLSLANTSIQDQDLVELRNLKMLKRLNLGGTLVTDAAIAHLQKHELTWINVGNSKLTLHGVGELQRALVSAEVEHNSIARSRTPVPIPDRGPSVSKESLQPIQPVVTPTLPNSNSADLPPADHSRIKDGTPILAQILRTGAFVKFRDDNRLKPIQEISFAGLKVTDKSLKPLAELTSLDVLSVEDTRVTDSGFRNIVKLENLGSIRIARSNVSSGVLGHLSGLAGLESLMVDDLQLTDIDLSQIRNLTKLHTLDLGATQITDEGLKNIGQWYPKLKVLKLLTNRVSAAGIQVLREALPAAEIEVHSYDAAAIAAARAKFVAENTPEAEAILERLKKRGASIEADRESPEIVLNLEGGDFSDADLVELKQLLNLSNLTLKDLPITDEGIMHLQTLPRLRALNLSGTRVTDKTLGFLTNQKFLDVLVLSGTSITNDGMQLLGKITSLKLLWLDDTAVTDEGLIHLKSLSLERLEVPQITDRGLQHIAHLTELTRLDLPNVSDDGLKNLQDLKALDILILGSKVTNAGLKHLAPLRDNLNVLSLSGTKITDDGLASLKDFSRLEYLFLNDTEITDNGLEQLKSFANLRRVDLQGTAVTEAGAESYRKTLPPFRTVNR
jgi:Leucine-rich repeat (LRR) protein